MQNRSPRQYAKILYDLTHDATTKEVEARVGAFLALVKKEQSIKKMPAIVDAFEEYSKEKQGIVTAAVTLAHEFSARQLKGIIERLGNDIEATATVDPSLLGGIVVQTRDVIMDASMKTQLKLLYQHMTQEA